MNTQQSAVTDAGNAPREIFKINDVAFDMEAKEHVLITNQICTLDHSNSEAFAKSHGENGIGACAYVPHEAIAIRAFPTKSGKPQIAWTYRSVNVANLRTCDQSAKEMFESLFNHKRSKFNLGRI